MATSEPLDPTRLNLAREAIIRLDSQTTDYHPSALEYAMAAVKAWEESRTATDLGRALRVVLDLVEERRSLAEIGDDQAGRDMWDCLATAMKDDFAISSALKGTQGAQDIASAATKAWNDLDWLVRHIPELKDAEFGGARPGDKITVDIGILSVLFRARDRLNIAFDPPKETK